MKRSALTICVLSVALLAGVSLAPVFGEVVFSDLQTSRQGTAVFTATVTAPAYGEYRTAFAADLDTKELRQLTVFPESVSLVQESGDVRIQNRFGLFRLNPTDGIVRAELDFPAFTSGDEIRNGKVRPVLSSPDGDFLVYLEPVSAAYGKLMLYSFSDGTDTVISEDVELTFDLPPARWSPDGSLLVYCVQNRLYYYSMQQHNAGRVHDQEIRLIGNGTIANISWESQGDLYYVIGSLVYRIRPNEFFTRTMYRDVMRIGEIVGKLPFSFDPNFDGFTVSPNGGRLLFTKSQRNIFLLFLQEDDYNSTGQVVSLPYLYLPRNTRIGKILWSQDDIATIITEALSDGDMHHQLFRLDMRGSQENLRFVRLEQTVRDVALGPLHENVLLVTDSGVEIRRYSDWRLQREFTHENPLHALWINNHNVLIAGAKRIEIANLASGAITLAGFSQPDSIGIDSESEMPAVISGEHCRVYDWNVDQWDDVQDVSLLEPETVTETHRIYLESLPSSNGYANQVMVRNVRDVGTQPLFARPGREYEAFPAADDPFDGEVFAHGSRIRRREVSLVFNAIDSVEGLTEIMSVLRDYNIKATFFVNGEFIARHPEAVVAIAESGHEVGNMFHSYFDMTDSRFRITKDFIQQGLARNEDDYYYATGREMSLLWHAPYYYVGSSILQAAAEMNYTYVGRDVDSLDWVPRYSGDTVSTLYQGSSDLIERIVDQKKPGSIIAMRIGTPGDELPFTGREDYLFHRLDVLVNALVERGYSFVPVSVLRDRVQ